MALRVAISFLIFASWLAGSADAAFVQEIQFGDVATLSVAWGYGDADELLDLAVANYGGGNQIFRNNGDGTFTGSVLFAHNGTFAATWGDYDNDGDADLAIGRGSNLQNYLYVNNGDGTFTARPEFGLLRTNAMAWADYDLDGDLDLAVGNGLLGVAQQNYLYVNNGDGTFTARPEFGMGQSAAVAWADVDGDGDADLAVGNGGFGPTGPNFLYINEGDGTFTERADFGERDTASLAWGDCDADGDLDLAVGNWNAGGCLLYVNDGAGRFTGQPAFGARDTNTLAWGDCDNDGDLDLATGNGDFQSAEQNYLYINDGTARFTEVPEFGQGSTDGIAWGDGDGDGDLDAAIGNEHSPTQNYLYRNLESDADFLIVRARGRFHERGPGWSNRDAIGARLRVYEAGHLGENAHLLGMREIEAHGGFAAQNAPDAHFGLPGRSEVDLRILWPGSAGRRIVQDIAGVPVGARIVVEEEGSPASVPAQGLPTVTRAALRAWPNPARGATLLCLSGAAPGSGSPAPVTIHDVLGRVVRVLPVAVGANRVEWDGRTGQGGLAPEGVYLARLPGARPARIVRMP